MQLIIGGAYAGKRKAVVDQFNDHDISWLSSYDGGKMETWRDNWIPGHLLVLEGFENWLLDDIQSGNFVSVEKVREKFGNILKEIKEEETSGQPVCVIMLEVGRGIVPVEQVDRTLRDMLGWIQQDATALADDVYYVWHGLVKKMK